MSSAIRAHGPVTIGDLTREGKLLEIGCLACNRHIYVDPGNLRLPDALPVPSAAARLVCSSCGARDGAGRDLPAQPDARAPGIL